MVVALRKESVDRNPLVDTSSVNVSVALRKESVDRNEWIKAQYPGCRVALRKESVDRNKCSFGNPYKKPWSLSARRAWIEIRCAIRPATGRPSRSPQGERG